MYPELASDDRYDAWNDSFHDVEVAGLLCLQKMMLRRSNRPHVEEQLDKIRRNCRRDLNQRMKYVFIPNTFGCLLTLCRLVGTNLTHILRRMTKLSKEIETTDEIDKQMTVAILKSVERDLPRVGTVDFNAEAGANVAKADEHEASH